MNHFKQTIPDAHQPTQVDAPCQYTIVLDTVTDLFFAKVAKTVELPQEQVLSDALFRYAATLSLQALAEQAN